MQLDVMAILTPVTPHFCPEGRLVNGEHIERGHINRTFVSTIEMDGVQRRYVHQLINSIVFPNPPLMMENIRRVIDHLRLKRPDDPGLLELISNEDGHIFGRMRTALIGERTITLKARRYSMLFPMPK
ncbi:hypothetical protein QPK87_17555 [Kamptonema cortianum]|nr:hypothetical protein [Geitlerinema splendidum]MDK3158361.1 hypothetical protein [Kamptonema cortianum]